MGKQTLNIARGLSLDLSAITNRFAFLARTGAGKTYCAGVLAEEMLSAGAQVVVLDPMAKWWGLRLAANGKDRAFDIPVFGGPHGDIPLTSTSGELVAKLIVEEEISCILDLSDFDSDAEQRRFVTAFAKKLYRLKQRQNPPTPMHLILEEAEEFLPQDQMRDQAQMIGAVKKLLKLGRNYGIGASLVSQRSADVNKKGLSQVGTMVAMQTTSPHDRKAMKEWAHGLGDAEMAAQVGSVLPKLKVGEALFWSPGDGIAKKIKFRRKKTFDSSATPKGVKRKSLKVKKLNPGKLEGLVAAMAEVVDEQKKNDPRALRKRINELQRELKKAQKGAPVASKTIEVPMVDTAAFRDLRQAAQKAADAAAGVGAVVDRLESEAAAFSVRSGIPSPRDRVPWRDSKKRPVVTLSPRMAKARAKHLPRTPLTPPNGDLKIKKGARKMLAVLAAKSPLTKQQLGTLAGFKITGGTFNDYLGTLRRAGLVAKAGVMLDITEAGRVYIGDDAMDVPMTTEELLAFWGQKVKAGARKMLATLVQLHPKGLSKGELAETLEYAMTGGTFNDYVGTLRRNGLVTHEDGVLYASDTLFP